LRPGLLGPQSHVWRVGFTRWLPIAEVDEFSLHTANTHGRISAVFPKNRTKNNRTYIGRHWRGEHSLIKSYWLHGILAALLTFAVALLGEAMIEPVLYPVAYASFWICLLILLGLSQVWVIVGVWRSASRYAVEQPKRYWVESRN
jgi:hypothetical protein